MKAKFREEKTELSALQDIAKIEALINQPIQKVSVSAFSIFNKKEPSENTLQNTNKKLPAPGKS